MIYPPTGSQGPQADQTPNRDPDRQLALMLVVLAVATALLFYAAELGPSSLARYLGIGERFGQGTGAVTGTLPVDMTPPPETPTEDTPQFGNGSDEIAAPTPFPTLPFPTLAIGTPTRPILLTTPTTTPLAGEGWPSPELTTPGSLPTSTKGSGSGYPGLTPGATSGYPSPGSPTRGPSPNASGGTTPTPGPGDS